MKKLGLVLIFVVLIGCTSLAKTVRLPMEPRVLPLTVSTKFTVGKRPVRSAEIEDTPCSTTAKQRNAAVLGYMATAPTSNTLLIKCK